MIIFNMYILYTIHNLYIICTYHIYYTYSTQIIWNIKTSPRNPAHAFQITVVAQGNLPPTRVSFGGWSAPTRRQLSEPGPRGGVGEGFCTGSPLGARTSPNFDFRWGSTIARRFFASTFSPILKKCFGVIPDIFSPARRFPYFFIR